MAEKDDILAQAREAFDCAVDAENENRLEAANDLRFARLGEQWPDDVAKARKNRPMLTINKMPAFSRQVVNDARQNKPSIKVHPVDSGADPDTADVINGLIRNIETTSNADVAYDTATGFAVDMGWGYFKIDLDYAHDDTFDMDLRIEAVANPFSIYGDPYSRAADSSDWNTAFEVDWMPHKDFEAAHGEKVGKVDWQSYGSGIENRTQWVNDKEVLVAKWWRREEVARKILQLSDGRVVAPEFLEEVVEIPDMGIKATNKEVLDTLGISVKGERDTKSWKVKRYVMTGADVLNDEKGESWPGIYIPIIPVYGDDVNIEGKRYLRSLIRDAKDAQRMFNYWRTTATELVALAPRVPFIGPAGFAKKDKRWHTANTGNHPYLEYEGSIPPQRQPLDTGSAAGALQEALNASDDMKAIMGLYDASLGARSNETSGVAINARKKEGDVSTFHFQDNMSRAIRHAGRILIDLIPKVYNEERIVRVLGEDGTPKNVPLKQPVPVTDPQGKPVMDETTGQPKSRIYDLTAGKYDLTVSAGPSFTTRREEAAVQMTEMVRAFPQAAPLIGDLIAKNLDWPGADEIAERFKAMVPQQAQGGLPPEVEQMIQQGQQMIQQLTQENQTLKAGEAVKGAEIQLKNREIDLKDREIALKDREIQIKAYEAQTDRLQALKPEPVPQPKQPQGQF